MQISWIKKTTLLDYPGKVATLIFTLWCNFRCKYCHNSEFVLPEEVKKRIPFLIKEEAFFNFLEKRKDFLDWVVICGWEPTIQADLKDFCIKIKEKTWLLIKLDTNWTNPKILKELINEKLIDYLAMDIKDDLKSSDLIWVKKNDKIKESVEILKKGRVDYEFRTTFIKG
jgi:pyruvate formate lyase activating enzyme